MKVATIANLLFAAGALAATCRWEEPPPPGDECYLANDGDCDDGGPGSEFSQCPWGTDSTDCGRRLEVERNESLYAITADRRLSEWDGTCPDGGCSCSSFLYLHTGDCGPFMKKSACWSSEFCCAESTDDCCEPDVGVITGTAIGSFVGLCAMIGGCVLCCIFLSCCKCCPCNKAKKQQNANSAPSGMA